jgi:hypothetical protein
LLQYNFFDLLSSNLQTEDDRKSEKQYAYSLHDAQHELMIKIEALTRELSQMKNQATD